VIVDHFGYSATFLTLGAAALVALIVFVLGMPETAEREAASSPMSLSNPVELPEVSPK